MTLQKQTIGNIDDLSTWTVGNVDTTNLLSDTSHVINKQSVKFDKIDGAANSKLAFIESTIDPINLSRFSHNANLSGVILIPALTLVVDAFIRIGTDSSNYNEWVFPKAGISENAWDELKLTLLDIDNARSIGEGINTLEVKYVAIGVGFNAETNVLAEIKVNNILIFE